VDDDAQVTPSRAPGENVLPGAAEVSMLLRLDDGSALGVTGVLVYPDGFLFELWLYRPDAPVGTGPTVPASSVLRLRYADGRAGETTVPGLPRPRPGRAATRAPELLVLPRHATLGPGPARQQLWVSPLPPAGPVELNLTAVGGHQLAAATLSGDELLRAAGRAVEVWPGSPTEPAFDAALAPALPPAGPPPDDPDAALAEIRRAFQEVFTAYRDGLPFVQDGDVLRGAAEQARERWPEVAATLQVGLGEVAFLDEVRAAVQYQLSWSGPGGQAPQVGYAVLERGSWKVARGTYTRLLDAAGVQYPPPPPMP
jgi:hypothetical protein